MSCRCDAQAMVRTVVASTPGRPPVGRGRTIVACNPRRGALWGLWGPGRKGANRSCIPTPPGLPLRRADKDILDLVTKDILHELCQRIEFGLQFLKLLLVLVIDSEAFFGSGLQVLPIELFQLLHCLPPRWDPPCTGPPISSSASTRGRATRRLTSAFANNVVDVVLAFLHTVDVPLACASPLRHLLRSGVSPATSNNSLNDDKRSPLTYPFIYTPQVSLVDVPFRVLQIGIDPTTHQHREEGLQKRRPRRTARLGRSQSGSSFWYRCNTALLPSTASWIKDYVLGCRSWMSLLGRCCQPSP